MPKIAKKKLRPILKEILSMDECGYDDDTLVTMLQRRLEELDNAKV